MKKMSLLFLIVCFSATGFSQQRSLDAVTLQRNKITAHSMLVLGGWSLLNISTGMAMAPSGTGSAKYFYRMNSYFGGVNGLLAISGYVAAKKKAKVHVSLSESYKQQRRVERVFLFNSGLDLAYIMGGLYWYERGNSKTGAERGKAHGYGKSIMVQGGFLFVFDGIAWLLHNANGKWFDEQMGRINLGAGPGGISLLVKL